MERLGDERLVHLRTVAVGGVEEVHAELDRPPQHPMRRAAILGRPPDVGTADAHRTEPHPVHRQVAEPDGTRSRGGAHPSVFLKNAIVRDQASSAAALSKRAPAVSL